MTSTFEKTPIDMQGQVNVWREGVRYTCHSVSQPRNGFSWIPSPFPRRCRSFAEKWWIAGSELGMRSSSPATNSHKQQLLLFSSVRTEFFKHMDRGHLSLWPLSECLFIFFQHTERELSFPLNLSDRPLQFSTDTWDGRAAVGQKNLFFPPFPFSPCTLQLIRQDD